MKHITDIKQLTSAEIQNLIQTAEEINSLPVTETQKWHPGRSIMALFFENSTRTLCSFQLACQRLGIDLTALSIAHSSTAKGETIKDTMLTLNAMQTDAFIIRHQENEVHQKIINWIGNDAAIINAGDGTNQHPTQGLLDLYTIWQHKQQLTDLNITIIGDIAHSRVANSLIDGLNIMGSNTIKLFGPEGFIPEHLMSQKAASMEDALTAADVIVMLRIQKERLPEDLAVDFNQWHNLYGLNTSRLKLAKPDAIVMHPGPMNRSIEISDDVADGSQSAILEQVRNGVLMRQAIIHQILKNR